MSAIFRVQHACLSQQWKFVFWLVEYVAREAVPSSHFEGMTTIRSTVKSVWNAISLLFRGETTVNYNIRDNENRFTRRTNVSIPYMKQYLMGAIDLVTSRKTQQSISKLLNFIHKFLAFKRGVAFRVKLLPSIFGLIAKTSLRLVLITEIDETCRESSFWTFLPAFWILLISV